MADESWESALKLAQEGKTREAHVLFEKIVSTDVHNISAWFWYAKTGASGAERTRILQNCLRFNPDSAETRQVLGLAPLPQPEPPAVSPQHSANSLTFKAPGSAAPESDSGESTKPLKAYVPAPVAANAAPAAQRTRVPLWLVLLIGFLLVVFLGIAAWVAFKTVPSAPSDPGNFRHVGAVEYYLYVPKAYTANRDWPLFVGVHGFGGSGLDCWNWWQPYADREGFVLLCPTLADAGGGWYQDDGETKLFSVINEVHAQYRLAPQEFLAGFSAGAQFVQGFAFKYPQYVSAVAILSSGNYYPPSYAAKIPMLVVIGDRDDPGAISTAADFSTTLKASGHDIQYVVLPGIGHTLTKRGQELTIELFRKTQGE